MNTKAESKFKVGEKAGWCAPYGFETVTISEVNYNEKTGFRYKTEEYPFQFKESELR